MARADTFIGEVAHIPVSRKSASASAVLVPNGLKSGKRSPTGGLRIAIGYGCLHSLFGILTLAALFLLDGFYPMLLVEMSKDVEWTQRRTVADNARFGILVGHKP